MTPLYFYIDNWLREQKKMKLKEEGEVYWVIASFINTVLKRTIILVFGDTGGIRTRFPY